MDYVRVYQLDGQSIFVAEPEEGLGSSGGSGGGALSVVTAVSVLVVLLVLFSLCIVSGLVSPRCRWFVVTVGVVMIRKLNSHTLPAGALG